MIAKMKYIHELKLQGKTYEEICKIVGNHETAVVAFNKYYERHFTDAS